MLMLLYVLVAVPLSVAFVIETKLWSAAFFVDMIVVRVTVCPRTLAVQLSSFEPSLLTCRLCLHNYQDIWFITDVFLNFRTAFYTPSGHREGEPSAIARNYMKRWFVVDFVSSLPVQYVQYVVQAKDKHEGATDNLKIVKSLRLMRLAKMLRIARLRKFVQKYAGNVSSAQWMPAISLLFIILFLCHILACAWYLAGGSYQELSNGRLISGWVFQELDWYSDEVDLSRTCMLDAACRLELELTEQSISLGTRYSTSMYYVFNALEHGFTDTEKVVAVVSELTLGLIYGMLAGLMSSLLIVIGSGEAELQEKVVQLRQWMNSHQMPKLFQQQALAYFHRVWETKLPVALEHEMGLALPPAMNLYMTQHMYGSALRHVPMFRSLGLEIFAELCRRVKPMLCLSGEYLMQCGDIGTDFFVLLSGELKVSEADADAPDGLRFLGFLAEGAFFGEVPLLSEYASGSEVRKRTVQAVTESRLCYISQDTITDMRRRFPELDARLRRFALVGTSTNAALKRLAKHNLDPSEIRQLQQQTRHSVNAKLEGAIGMRAGDGHRLTRYQYDFISGWSEEDPRAELQPNAPRPPVSASLNTGRVGRPTPRQAVKSAQDTTPTGEAGPGTTKSLDALRVCVEALCPHNDEARSVRSRSIWIK